jgi:hypothetical protein
VAGFGGLGYELALDAVRRVLDGDQPAPNAPAVRSGGMANSTGDGEERGAP